MSAGIGVAHAMRQIPPWRIEEESITDVKLPAWSMMDS
jgi:hypothetical protein